MPEEQFDLANAGLSDQLLKLPSSIFNPNRIRIMLALYYMSGSDFSQLKKDLNLSDGALATHLRSLRKDGLIETRRERAGNRTVTAYLITQKGAQVTQTLLDDFVNIRKAIPA